MGVGPVQVHILKHKAPFQHLYAHFHIRGRILVVDLGLVALGVHVLDEFLHVFFAFMDLGIVKLGRPDGKISGVEFLGMVHLAVGNPVGRQYVGHGMGLREQVLHRPAGPDVEVRNIGLLQSFRLLVGKAVLVGLPFPAGFHNAEGNAGLHPFVDQVGHDIVTGGNGFVRGVTFLNQVLGIFQPHAGTMGIPGNTQ